MFYKKVTNSLLDREDELVKVDSGYRQRTHRTINVLFVVMMLLGGYLAFGKYSDLASKSYELTNSYQSLNTQEGAELNLKGMYYGSSSRTSYTNAANGGNRKGGGFFLGCIMIAIALPMVWMNERRSVKTFEVIQKAKKAVQQIDCMQPQESENYMLVRAFGRATTQLQLSDTAFGIVKNDTVKIRRTVEVYQWKEESTKKDNNQMEYTHTKEWTSEPINMNNFGHKEACPGVQNPPTWPCKSETFTNTAVDLGQFAVSSSQIEKLNNWKVEDLGQFGQFIIDASLPFLQENGWLYMVNNNDGYLYTRMSSNHFDGSPLGQQIGDMRVKFETVECGPLNVMAQQMQDDKGRFTFRQWNPERTDVPWGEDNGSETDAHCPMACVCCFVVEWCFKNAFQDVIDLQDHDEQGSPMQMLNEYDSVSKGTTVAFRILAWVLNFVGHCLLFAPIIALLKWIPLVGYFLGTVFAVAAYLFSLVWASFLHFLVMGVAWVFYRPVYGVLLLALSAMLMFLMTL